MSYNYNQYSPYWQQPSGQSTPQSAGPNVAQSRTSYQPLSAYQNNQQTAQPSMSQPAEYSGRTSYGTQGYGNVAVNGAGNGRGRPHDFPTSYASTNDRASLNGATALGNLAYASSLERNGSAQQSSNYNRQQSNSNYGTASPYGINSAPPSQDRTGDERRESSNSLRDDTNARAQEATAPPSFDYNWNVAAYQKPSHGNNTLTQSQYPQLGSASEQHRLNQYAQQPRSTNGQEIQQPRSGPDSQAAPSTTRSTTQSTVNQSQGRNAGGHVRETTQTQIQTPQQSTYRPSPSQAPDPSRGNTQGTQTHQNSCETGIKHSANSTVKSKATAHLSAKETAAKRVSDAHQSPTVNANRQVSKPATPVEPQYTTVDPSQVFNHAEYTRRQAAAAAEVAATKKAAEEAEAARTAATQSKLPETNGASVVACAPGVEPDSAKKDQIELEMKQMIEKMRDYKAKDPSLFAQIWEQVKKSQPPQRAPSQSLQGSATSPVVRNGQSPSPSKTQNQLPPESDLPASDEFPPDFDRGRFPAQRRRRGGGMKATGRKSASSSESIKPVAQPQTAEDRGSPLPPKTAFTAPKVGQIFPDPGSQSMQQAMQQFHENSKSPVTKAQEIPGSNEQAPTNTSTSPPKAPPSIVPPSRPVPSQSVPPRQTGGTYWPESKKKALAEAARIALTSAPRNQGKPITTQEIHELLDLDPSYIQMCEILEYRGFIIDRGQFARILLKAVPDLGSASRSANAASTSTANADSATPTHATPTATASNTTTTTTTTKATSATPTAGSFGMLVKTTPNDSATQTKITKPLPYSVPPAAPFQTPSAYVTPYFPTPPSAEPASGGNPSYGVYRDYRFVDPAYWTPDMSRHHASVTTQGRHEPAPHSHPSVSAHQYLESINSQILDQTGGTNLNGSIAHPTKQEMARKRTFDEIVDLTQMEHEEESDRHRPKPRTDNESALDPSKSFKGVFDNDARRQQNSGRSTPKPFKYKYTGRDALLQSYNIVEPMNKRRDALRRSTYNPKTIARDILLSVGKHPVMAPLNAHLDVLKDRFKAVDNDSDLSTFRWDLVDPEGENNMGPSNTDDEEPIPVVNAGNHQRPAPTAVMVNIGRNGIAKEHQSSSHVVNSMVKQSKRGPYRKTDVPSGVQPVGSAETPERQPPQVLPDAQDISKVSGTISTDLSRFAYNSPYTAQTGLATSDVSNSSAPATATRHKGRPPGAKNKQVRPDKGMTKEPKTPSKGATTSTAKATSPDKSIVGKSSPSGNSSVRNSSAPISARHRINTTTPSRPSGLRHSVSALTPTDGIAVVIPSRSPSSVIVTPQPSAKKARPQKAEDRSEDRSNGSPLAPTHTMYRCRWEKCPAELHNLETLKKHVKKHRRAVNSVYPCLWADCSDSSNPISNKMQNGDGQYKRLQFKTDAEWATHVESIHLRTETGVSAGASVNGSIRAKSDSNGSGFP